MDINNNTNITSLVSTSISKLNLNTRNRAFQEATKKTDEEKEQVLDTVKEEDKKLVEESEIKTKIDVQEIQKYAESVGEKLTIDDINYGLRYGRSVIADYSA